MWRESRQMSRRMLPTIRSWEYRPEGKRHTWKRSKNILMKYMNTIGHNLIGIVTGKSWARK